MTDLATALASNQARPIVVLQIEGHGTKTAGGTDMYRYCTTVPTFAESDVADPETGTDGLWRPWIDAESWPSSLSERVPILGGLPSAGSFSVLMTDIGNQLTSDWRTDAEPVCKLGADYTVTDTLFTFSDGANIAASDFIWTGSEAIRVASKPTADTAIVERGALGTTARPLNQDDLVYAFIRYLRGRRVFVWLTHRDADAWDASNRYKIGEYNVVRYPTTEDYNGYSLSCKSSHQILAADVAGSVAFRGRVYVTRSAEHLIDIEWEPITMNNVNTGGRALGMLDTWAEGSAYFLIDETEAVEVSGASWFQAKIEKRQQLGTERVNKDHRADPNGASLKTGELANSKVQLIIGADTDGPGWFRYSSTNSTSRASGFEKSDIWVDILLNLLTSSADDTDALELANGDATYGNWSCLPIGYGLGIPVSEIDLQSFVEIKQRHPWRFPDFWYGAEPESFAAMVDKFFLKPLGAYLTIIDGLITLRYPTIPATEAGETAWGEDIILVKDQAGAMIPAVMPGQDTANVFGAVQFEVRNASGFVEKTVYKDADFPGFDTARSYYKKADKPLRLELRGVRATQTGTLAGLGMRKLWRTRRIPDTFTIETGLDQYLRAPGDLVGLTLAAFPDRSTGTRGVADMLGEIVSREVPVTPGDTHISFHVYSYGPGIRLGRIAPSAHVATFSGSGPYTVTVTTNLYCRTDAINSWPTADAGAFAADDVVILLNPDGSVASGANTETISGVSGNDITVPGNWGGALAADLIVVFADRGAARAEQHTTYCYVASDARTPPDVGGSGDAPWRWGE